MKVNVAHFLLAAAAETGICAGSYSQLLCVDKRQLAGPGGGGGGGGWRRREGHLELSTVGRTFVAMATGSGPQRVY